MNTLPEDLDYLVARVHGRYARATELRLQALGALQAPEALWGALFPDAPPSTARALQRRLLLDWWGELQALARGLAGPRARLLEAVAERVDVEDRKILLRGRLGGRPRAEVETERIGPRARAVRRAPRPPPPPPREDAGGRAPAVPADRPGPLPRALALESALDQRHLQHLLAALAGLEARERREVSPLLHQEVDHHHLLLVARGRFTHGLSPASLLARHVAGAAIGRERLAAMLAAPDLPGAAAMAVGLALDDLPPPSTLDAGALDAAAWRRYLRLARRTFREGGMGFAAVVGYAGLRLVEVRDLTTLSEGARLGAAAEAVARLLRGDVGVAHA